MTDKRGNWSRDELEDIWFYYTEYVVTVLYPYEAKYIDQRQETICYLCNKRILKAQYSGWQDGDYSWDVEHFDGNPHNNNTKNLFIAHPWCNKQKGNRSIQQLLLENNNNFYNKYVTLRNNNLIL